ncbi:hypothetical protein SAMN04487949_1663 [Halogranum gelatinilyticum]|uniref:Luciferase domain-containing protein n=1 Tax=Halogranum gelatinilyticum TaxID=660521 RepID=A0A1G9T8C3_9EURY|nr:luciferase family protein [Halogranum gelatinilyticum]SDM43914.1 hypothetical protein SAMN04487949_1663 [Halogranum gelatinilyticum]
MTTAIETTVAAWPGVAVDDHRFGGREFTLAGREFGHLHGSRQADIPFPKRVRDVVVAAGLTSKHHLYPDSGWVTKYLERGDDETAVDLLRLNYLYQVAALQRRETVDEAIVAIDVAAELDAMALPDGLRELFPLDSSTGSGSGAAAEG